MCWLVNEIMLNVLLADLEPHGSLLMFPFPKPLKNGSVWLVRHYLALQRKLQERKHKERISIS